MTLDPKALEAAEAMRLHHHRETTSEDLRDRAVRLSRQGGMGYEASDFYRDIITYLNARTSPANDASLIEKLREELDMFATGGVIEVAIRNPNVADYMKHWETRAETAESTLSTAQARIRELEGLVSEAVDAFCIDDDEGLFMQTDFYRRATAARARSHKLGETE